jgi:hypothetical protein
VTEHDALVGYRLRLFTLADELGSVSEACRMMRGNSSVASGFRSDWRSQALVGSAPSSSFQTGHVIRADRGARICEAEAVSAADRDGLSRWLQCPQQVNRKGTGPH